MSASARTIKRFFILDRSGSMEIIKDNTIHGFNNFVNEQRQFGGTMSLVIFDQEITSVYSECDINNVPPLDNMTYMPRGTTALYDAIGMTISYVDRLLQHQHSNQDKDNVIIKFIILTDGFDNSSSRFKMDQIRTMIQTYTQLDWDFMFLGSNEEAIFAAKNIGIANQNTMTFNSANIDLAFRSLSLTMSQQAQGIDVSISQYSQPMDIPLPLPYTPLPQRMPTHLRVRCPSTPSI